MYKVYERIEKADTCQDFVLQYCGGPGEYFFMYRVLNSPGDFQYMCEEVEGEDLQNLKETKSEKWKFCCITDSVEDFLHMYKEDI